MWIAGTLLEVPVGLPGTYYGTLDRRNFMISGTSFAVPLIPVRVQKIMMNEVSVSLKLLPLLNVSTG